MSEADPFTKCHFSKSHFAKNQFTELPICQMTNSSNWLSSFNYLVWVDWFAFCLYYSLLKTVPFVFASAPSVWTMVNPAQSLPATAGSWSWDNPTNPKRLLWIQMGNHPTKTKLVKKIKKFSKSTLWRTGWSMTWLLGKLTRVLRFLWECLWGSYFPILWPPLYGDLWEAICLVLFYF